MPIDTSQPSTFSLNLREVFKKPSIRAYLIFMNLILLCLLFPTVSFLFLNEEAKFRDIQLNRTINQLQKSLENRGSSLARSMALSSSQAIAGYDFTFLNIMVNQVASDDPEISYCIVMDTNARAITHSDPLLIGNVLDSESDMKVKEKMDAHFPLLTSIKEQSGHILFLYHKNETSGKRKNHLMEAIAPLYNGERLWGVLRLGYSLTSLNQEISHAKQDWSTKLEQFKIYLFSMTGIFFFLGVLVAALFTRSFVRSVKVLSDGVSKISEGNLDYEILQNGLVCSEVMDLSGAFNSMTGKLRASHKKLDEYNRSLEQKVHERTRELQEAQANLMHQAHEAGMAEMAVGILHNIGNAITPAKVTASLLQKKMKKSATLKHAPEIMSQFDAAIQSETCSMPTDDKKRLTELVRILPKSLADEYEMFIHDVEQIRDKHEHIEGIINLQMRYAKLFGHFEEVDINEITNDALKIMDDSIRKRAVQIEMLTNEVPKIKFEKAKLIQIIVNLIKNAYESMDNVPTADRKITIKTRFEAGPPDFVVLSIKDNGVGFSPAEKEKLFSFGYTSKKRGSGFGLHSCANYLIANKSTISANCEGIGKGAEFIIKLAISTDKEKNH